MSIQGVVRIGRCFNVFGTVHQNHELRFIRDPLLHGTRCRMKGSRQRRISFLCLAEADRGDSKGAAMASELKVVEQLDRLIDALLACKSREEVQPSPITPPLLLLS